jgi:hypothetical protein
MAVKNCVVERLLAVVDNNTAFDVLAPQHDPGELFCLQLVSFAEDSHAPTSVSVGFRAFDALCWLESFSSLTANLYTNYYKPVWLPSEYRIVVRFSAATLADVVHVNILGYYMPEKASEQ